MFLHFTAVSLDSLQLNLILVLEIIRERISPLAAYDLSSDEKAFTAYISLVENCLGNGSCQSFWLKIALLVGDSTEDNESDTQNFLNLGFISNTIGKLIIPNIDDWVELTSVS